MQLVWWAADPSSTQEEAEDLSTLRESTGVRWCADAANSPRASPFPKNPACRVGPVQIKIAQLDMHRWAGWPAAGWQLSPQNVMLQNHMHVYTL